VLEQQKRNFLQQHPQQVPQDLTSDGNKRMQAAKM
jgi:hypothetical protein